MLTERPPPSIASSWSQTVVQGPDSAMLTERQLMHPKELNERLLLQNMQTCRILAGLIHLVEVLSSEFFVR
jgi:hypothetical protein